MVPSSLRNRYELWIFICSKFSISEYLLKQEKFVSILRNLLYVILFVFSPLKIAWGVQKRVCPYYWVDCSQTDLITDLPMVCKCKFVRYSQNNKELVLYVPRFNSDGPPKSGASNFQNLRLIDFKALAPNLFCL